jgi:transposase
MGPYSNDLRERVAAAVDHGEGSPREIARRFRVSLAFIVRSLQRRRVADTLEPKPHGGGTPRVLGPDDHRRLAEWIRETPDATWKQLKGCTKSQILPIIPHETQAIAGKTEALPFRPDPNPVGAA